MKALIICVALALCGCSTLGRDCVYVKLTVEIQTLNPSIGAGTCEWAPFIQLPEAGLFYDE